MEAERAERAESAGGHWGVEGEVQERESGEVELEARGLMREEEEA